MYWQWLYCSICFLFYVLHTRISLYRHICLSKALTMINNKVVLTWDYKCPIPCLSYKYKVLSLSCTQCIFGVEFMKITSYVSRHPLVKKKTHDPSQWGLNFCKIQIYLENLKYCPGDDIHTSQIPPSIVWFISWYGKMGTKL